MEANQLMGLMVLALYLLVIFAPFLLLTVLMFKKNREFHDKVLVAWLAVSIANSFIEFLKISESPSSIPFLLDLNKALLVSNLFFFLWYFSTLLRGKYTWDSKLTWTLLPFLVWVTACLGKWATHWLFFGNYTYNSLALEYEQFAVWLEVPVVLGVILVGLWVWSKLKEMGKSETGGVLLKEVWNLKKTFVTLIIIYFTVAGWEYGLSKVLNNEGLRLIWITFLLSLIVVLLVALGFFFFKQRGILKKRKNLPKTSELIDQLFQKVTKSMMDDKPYLNPGLTISKLAVLLEETPQKVSETIKIKTEQSFYSFINKHRVEEAKRLLKDTSYSSYSIVSIGLESGFNSKATFNRVFKNETGMTPSRYGELFKSAKDIPSKFQH